MEQFEIKKENKVVRSANRATYDKEQVYGILDDAFLCHVSFVMDGQPFIIPTAYAREGDIIYIHGSVKSRMINAVEGGTPICVCVTHMDGLVLARSAFHHSVNYRSAVIFGHASDVITNEEKNRALFLITENILKGRWDEVRQPNQKELDITSVLAIKIDTASAKIRTGGPLDDKEDYELPIWAGVLPIETRYGQPINDTLLSETIPVSNTAILAWKPTKE